MNDATIQARLNSIEEQIRILKAEVVQPRSRKSRARPFAELYGIWKGKVDLSLEDIQTAEIRSRDEE